PLDHVELAARAEGHAHGGGEAIDGASRAADLVPKDGDRSEGAEGSLPDLDLAALGGGEVLRDPDREGLVDLRGEGEVEIHLVGASAHHVGAIDGAVASHDGEVPPIPGGGR